MSTTAQLARRPYLVQDCVCEGGSLHADLPDMAIHVGLLARADNVVELAVKGRNGTCKGVRVVSMRTKLSLAGHWRWRRLGGWCVRG